MKAKSLIITVSVFLNLVLFSAVVYFDVINSHTTGAAAPVFRLQHLSAISHFQNNLHGIALASTMK